MASYLRQSQALKVLYQNKVTEPPQSTWQQVLVYFAYALWCFVLLVGFLMHLVLIWLDKYSSQFGGVANPYSYYHDEDESTFQLVDTSRLQKPIYQRGRVRFNQVFILRAFFTASFLDIYETRALFCLVHVWPVAYTVGWVSERVSGLYTHTHPFNGPFSGTTQVSQYQKGKTDRDFTEARDSEWQWHQLGHM